MGFSQERSTKGGATWKKKISGDSDDEGSSSESSDDEESSSRALSCRTPFLTQACQSQRSL